MNNGGPIKRYVLSLALALVGLAVDAAEAPLPKVLPPEQEATALRAAEVTGQAMYRHDRAALVATDVVRKLAAFNTDSRLNGWVTEEKQGQIVVTFIDQTPAALYRVVVSDKGVAGPAQVLATPAPLSDYEASAAVALATAKTVQFPACSRQYNSIVLPPVDASSPNWRVYLLPGTTKSQCCAGRRGAAY